LALDTAVDLSVTLSPARLVLVVVVSLGLRCLLLVLFVLIASGLISYEDEDKGFFLVSVV